MTADARAARQLQPSWHWYTGVHRSNFPAVTFYARLARKTGEEMPHSMSLDHVSLLVRSLDASEKFYTEVLGFTPIHNGTDQPHIRWYGIGGIDALHITQGDFADTRLQKPTHFAVNVDDFDGFVADLQSRQVPFWDWPGRPNNVTGRPDGFRQIYVQDPDGYWIEINDHTRHMR